jgi:hypothetical protein
LKHFRNRTGPAYDFEMLLYIVFVETEIWHGTAVLDLFGFPRFKTNEDLQAFLEQD